LHVPQRGALTILESLRSLSGRLALRLLSTSTQSDEVVGLLLARWLLQQNGFLADRAVIPLDAHRNWFQEERGGGGVALSRRRADLLVVGFDPEARALRFLIIEVKLRTDLSAFARSRLYTEMRQQAENTAQRLRMLFDLDFHSKPRADALLRSKELCTALSFYLKRAVRFGLA
jgi:hypothetical protein